MNYISVALLFMLASSSHASDGEMGWTRLLFCESGDYCVDIYSPDFDEASTIKVTYRGKAIEIPPEVNRYLPDAFLNRVRFVTTSNKNSTEKELIIPYIGSNADPVQRELVLRIAKDRVLSIQVDRASRGSLNCPKGGLPAY